jgi:phosphoserine phosphatase
LANDHSPTPAAADGAADSAVPLCVDLDGTLIDSDLLWESLAVLRRRNFLYLLMVPIWFLRGRAHLKQQVARRATIDPAQLPYIPAFINFLRGEKLRGRRLLLVSASERLLVEKVAAHVGLFDEVMASDGRTNLRGRAKCAALVAKFGQGGFDYAGNSYVDVPVWAGARKIIVVNAPAALVRKMRATGRVAAEFLRSGDRLD